MAVGSNLATKKCIADALFLSGSWFFVLLFFVLYRIEVEDAGFRLCVLFLVKNSNYINCFLCVCHQIQRISTVQCG